MKQYRLLNNICGWIVFVIAAVTYILTLEPTASFWDCGEFISSAYKLEVGHPPGNPIFMLTGRFFANFASDPSHVAYMINLMSALFSAATILLLFWTITHLARKIIVKDSGAMTLAQMIVILGCGAVGALAYTWSDTFWFSAVEGEVYAYSSFCTALVFWLILKWEDVADEPHSDRYIILIAYLIGISIAVHLLNLLTIPALVLVYYFRKFGNPTTKGALIALLLSFAGIVFLLYGLVPGFVKVAGWIELLCVNILGMPFNSGVIVYFFLVIGCISWGIYETYKQENINRLRISFLISVILVGLPFISGKIFIGILISLALAIFLFYKNSCPYDCSTWYWYRYWSSSSDILLTLLSSYVRQPIRQWIKIHPKMSLLWAATSTVNNMAIVLCSMDRLSWPTSKEKTEFLSMKRVLPYGLAL